jgi:hypothetical protein
MILKPTHRQQERPINVETTRSDITAIPNLPNT